jgi:hypothetical protein
MLGFMAGKVPVGQVSLKVLPFPITINPTMPHTHNDPSIINAI